MTLYEIQGEFLRLYELATTMEDLKAFSDTLEGLQGDLAVKAKGYVEVMKQIEMEANECDAVIQKFTEKKKARENALSRMKSALYDAMNTAELKELEAGEYKLKIVGNGGGAPLVISGNVPDNFMKLKYEADKTLIRKALEEGKELSFAHLEPRGTHLEIK